MHEAYFSSSLTPLSLLHVFLCVLLRDIWVVCLRDGDGQQDNKTKENRIEPEGPSPIICSFNDSCARRWPNCGIIMHSYTDKCLSRWPVFSKSNHKPFLYAVLKVQFESSLLKLG
jgi:hypothetical protein